MPKSFQQICKQAFITTILSGALLSFPSSSFFITPTKIAKAQEIIRRIEVNGNRRVEAATVRSYLDFNVGGPYDDALVNSSLRALFATGLFADVTISLQGLTVVVSVVENPIINKVAFEGNSELETSLLESEVRLKSRSVYTRARALSDSLRISELYRRQGHFSATVDPQLVELGDSRVNVIFEINEGNATKVKSINFIGNNAFSDSQLRDIISTTQSSWFDYFTSGGIYDPERMKLDKELLRQYYLKNGYADVRILSANAELAPDSSGFFLTFTVDEGALYKFGEVRVDNVLPELRSKSLEGSILTLSGDVYNAGNIDKTVEKLTLATAKQGFAFSRVRPRTDRDPVSRKINLTYVVDEGERIYIERINVIGNGRTKDHIIRREIRLVEGDAYNPLLIERANDRLRKLGFFKSVNVRRSPGSSRDRVVIDFIVVEQPTGELAFGAGYSSAEGIIGDISITERNLMGNGQFLRFKLGGSFNRAQGDLSFTEPRFMDKNISAGFDLFHKEVDLSDEASYKSHSTGTNFRLGFPLTENIWLATHYRLKRDELYDVEDDASIAIKDAEGKQVTSLFGSSISYDIRNHPKNPNRGLYLTLGADFAGIGGDVKYVRMQSEVRAYYPLYDKVTFVGRIIAGHIEGIGDGGVRLLDLFYKGGELIRGFDKAGLGPRDSNSGDALGGTTFWGATAEVRFPLPYLHDAIGMSGAVFADTGSLFGVSSRAENSCLSGNCTILDDESIRASLGASILWNSPLGPLRFDYAIPIKSEMYDDEQKFRFGAATKF
ncbi:MAG: Outer membrane protein assembly factor BamA [Hyphomicrobiaceae bacterium hypho_1]